MARRAFLLLAGLAAAVLLVEILLRIFIGFPARYIPHQTIEYVNVPNQDTRYRGKLIQTNRFGMRSPEIEETKPDDVFRIAVLGDSIVNGHIFTDQAELATSLLGAYTTADGRRIEALNIAANSWGPGNLLAWIDESGLFEADAAILVQNSDDLDDDRAFMELTPDSRPIRKPVSIIWDIFEREIAPRIGARLWPATPYEPRTIAGDARASLPMLLDRLKALPGGACLVVHEKLPEREAGSPGGIVEQFAALGEAHGLPVVVDRDFVEIPAGYRDDIHLSPLGQTQLLQAMLTCPALEGLRCIAGQNCAPHPAPSNETGD